MTDVEAVLERRRQRFAEPEPLPNDALDEGALSIFDPHQNRVLAMIVARLQDDTGDEIERMVRAAIKALREEAQVELAVVRDELNSRIDQKLFGSGLDYDSEEMRRSVFELRADATKRFDAITTLLDTLAERIDKVDQRRRYDRNTWHKEKVEMAEKVAEMLTTMSAKLDATGKKIDKVASDLESLETRTQEAFDSDAPGRRR
jgi:hypothetical protein